MVIDESILKMAFQKLIDAVDGTGDSALIKIGTTIDCMDNEMQIFIKVSADEDDFIDNDKFICIDFD